MTPKLNGTSARSLCCRTSGSVKISMNVPGPQGHDSGSDVGIRYSPNKMKTIEESADQGNRRGRHASHAVNTATRISTLPATRCVTCEYASSVSLRGCGCPGGPGVPPYGANARFSSENGPSGLGIQAHTWATANDGCHSTKGSLLSGCRGGQSAARGAGASL